ncbi:4-demethylwyosine synthase TYW1 [Candidatus Micrarchaeota archaeon]|nr:4-demethylwyosine synthase TYW1 [Candidatus Micrarchaeota archaeon]
MQENRIKEEIIDGKISFSKAVRKEYEKKYGLAGHHSGVQICSWNRKYLRNKGACYKQIFYGIDCHRCVQMSPALAWCQENCIFCWRPMEWMRKIEMKEEETDEPEEIIDETVKQRKRLICGIKGAEDVNHGLFKEAYEKFPSHWAISLSGEPTIYPKIGELIKKLKEHPEVKSVFLVTNGQEPERLEELKKNNCLPTQLYISADASDEETFKKVNRPVYSDGWERLNKTLGISADFPCRRVIRYTMIKGINDSEEMISGYAGLFEKAKADFIEIKAYMFIGFSRKRLSIENMPLHKEVKEFSEKLGRHLLNYEMINEHKPSRIVLFKRKDSKYPNLIRKSGH